MAIKMIAVKDTDIALLSELLLSEKSNQEALIKLPVIYTNPELLNVSRLRIHRCKVLLGRLEEIKNE